MIERSLVLLKPDAVQRGIVGEILHRFERAGLKMVAVKLTLADAKLADEHYQMTEKQLTAMGSNTLADGEKFNINIKEKLGTDDVMEIGKIIWVWNKEFLISGPVLAVVFEGLHAVQNIRTLVGPTIPFLAAPGTIRGDFSLDSAIGANNRKRTVYNLIHASGNVEEANREIALWFKPEEILSYKRVHEDLYKY